MPKIVYSAIHALYRIFSQLLSKGGLQRPKETAEKDQQMIIKSELRDNYIRYINNLYGLIGQEEPGLQIPSLNILLDLLRIESIYYTKASGDFYFPNNQYYRIVEALIDNENFNEHLLNEFVEKYWNIYDDLRFYFFKDIINFAVDNGKSKEKYGPLSKKIKNERSQEERLYNLMENTLQILENLRTMPTDSSEIDEFWTSHPAPSSILLQLGAHRKVFSDCWLSFFKLPMTEESYKKILSIMHKKIIPHMKQPTLLMDFLTDSYNAAISLLALNGLFTLINEHNLDYPDFYKKLYNLFDRNLMHVKYRSRFFRLADLFLSSTYVSPNIQMSHLSLTSPPNGIVIIIPMIYNLIRRHPPCMALIHRPNSINPETDSKEEIIFKDPYDFYEQDPLKSNAIDSSLWELKRKFYAKE
ncbi:15382_t:CDS:10 [Entrophospora sp. SA101]|nr:15382_t:CDS:10 [Entrophospora sp. SA101]CAJ0838356.1 1734_t:CDS:10 [Entrophospora sp. SA101]